MSFIDIASALPPLSAGRTESKIGVTAGKLFERLSVRSIAGPTMLLVVTVVCHVTVRRQVIKTESQVAVLRFERITAVPHFLISKK